MVEGTKDKVDEFIDLMTLLAGGEPDEGPSPENKVRAIVVVRENLGQLRLKGEDKEIDKSQGLDLFNRCLLACGLGKVDDEFFEVVLGESDWSDMKYLRKRVDALRILCMYYFGSFSFGFETLRRSRTGNNTSLTRELWREMYPDQSQITNEKEKLGRRATNLNVQPVDGDVLFLLGYIGRQFVSPVDSSRSMLLPALEEMQKSAQDDIRQETSLYEEELRLVRDIRLVEDEIRKVVPNALDSRASVDPRETLTEKKKRKRLKEVREKRRHLNNILFERLNKLFESNSTEWFVNVHDDAGLGFENGVLPKLDEFGPFESRLANAVRICQSSVQERIEVTEARGRQNTFAYLTLSDIDVYVATSMREPQHFTTTKAFVDRLKSHPSLAGLGLRVFDPTQSYSHERLDKGLVECLMIRNSRVTVYNAQESDTFGKDAEAAVSLAESHPVVVYVARLFSERVEFNTLRDLIDAGAQFATKDDYLKFIEGKSGLLPDEVQPLRSAEKQKSDVVDALVRYHAGPVVSNMSVIDIAGELALHGYRVPIPGSEMSHRSNEHLGIVRDHVMSIMSGLEKRALVFREGHPLAIQTSPRDGVARGVVVTRDVNMTAELVSSLLLGTVEYALDETNYSWLLREKRTGSPVRVITKDTHLRNAFEEAFREGLELEVEQLGRP